MEIGKLYRVDGIEKNGIWLEEIKLLKNEVVYTENYTFIEGVQKHGTNNLANKTAQNEQEDWEDFLEFEQFMSSMEPYHDPSDLKPRTTGYRLVRMENNEVVQTAYAANFDGHASKAADYLYTWAKEQGLTVQYKPGQPANLKIQAIEVTGT
jgi:hypothetical protein